MPAKSHKADEAAIRRLDEEWGNAATEKNLAAVVGFYAGDGSLVWPEQRPVHGTARIRANWKKMMHAYDGLRLRFIPERIVVSGDATLASDFGKVDFSYVDGGKRVRQIAKYVVVWRKERGRWRVLYDSWNTNKPAKQ